MTHTVKFQGSANAVPKVRSRNPKTLASLVHRLLPLPFVHEVHHYLRARDGAQLTGTGESQGRDVARALKLGECRGEHHIVAMSECLAGVTRVPPAHEP